MRICLIGLTGHIEYVFQGMAKDPACRIVGVAPGSPGEKTERVAGRPEVSEARFYADYRKMLDELRPDIAVVACYFCDHAKATVEALTRGCHVFVEKPLALAFDDLALVKTAYAASNRHLAAMFGLRYTPWFLTAWENVQKGMIGRIRLLNAQKSYKLGRREEFYHRRATYGGTLPWVGSHAIDWIHWFSGERFCSVYASHSRSFNREHGELETTALAHFTLTNEVFASVTLDYLRPEKAPTHDDDRLRLVGTEGIMEIRGGKVFLLDGEGGGPKELPLSSGGDIFSDFLRQVRGEGPSLVTAGDSFYITGAALQARRSADEGRVIFFPAEEASGPF